MYQLLFRESVLVSHHELPLELPVVLRFVVSLVRVLNVGYFKIMKKKTYLGKTHEKSEWFFVFEPLRGGGGEIVKPTEPL